MKTSLSTNHSLRYRNNGHGDNGTMAGSFRMLVVAPYPPRECGRAIYTQDLVAALEAKFNTSLAINICALESGVSNSGYPEKVTMLLDTTRAKSFQDTAIAINQNPHIKLILIQHEFALFRTQEHAFMQFIRDLEAPVVVAFHSVLPNPDSRMKRNVDAITAACEAVIVMTAHSAEILRNHYDVPANKLSVIAHGTHLVSTEGKEGLKLKYGLSGRKVLSTFGLIRSDKCIETTLDAMPAIIAQCPEALFLLLGKTHPEVVKTEGEKYRLFLEEKVDALKLRNHVKFINTYLTLPTLIDYLQLTDIYLYTSNDPNQAVSGNFVYAMSCSCPIISTPIPLALEVLTEDTGAIIDFGYSEQLSMEAIRLLQNDSLRRNMAMNTLQKIVFTAWENSAIAHARLFMAVVKEPDKLQYEVPEINLTHFHRLTDHFGIVHFAKLSQPHLSAGYTLDDNSRALVTMCMHYALFHDVQSLLHIRKYLKFIGFCQQANGSFLNYVNREYGFTEQNQKENLDDSNGRVVWALGYLMQLRGQLPESIIAEAEEILGKTLQRIGNVSSVRAIAFAIKGLYYSLKSGVCDRKGRLIETFANRMVQMYRHEKSDNWSWFEGYLTYANSILPEAMLYAWLATNDPAYRVIAMDTMKFLDSKLFKKPWLEVIANKTWLTRDDVVISDPQFSQNTGALLKGGEQPIDVAYTLMTLAEFYQCTKESAYLQKMEVAFSWFLGNNHLGQILYNPASGGCYNGLEEHQVNLNQGAESVIGYLMARLTMEKQKKTIAAGITMVDSHLKPTNHFNVLHEYRTALCATN